MAIKINFDVAHNPEEPTLILAKKNGDKLGKINAKAIEVADNLNDASEITFNVYKYIDNKKDMLWDLIVNFKLVYCVEWDKWFEATVEVDESNETVKTVFCTLLGQAELSQIMLYNIEINTDGEDGDIARDDYVIPTVLYRENEYDITENDKKFYKEVCKKDIELPYSDYKEASLLHRILKDKAPHYSVVHVDNTIKHMQRTFEFNDTSIYDACQEIAEELNCLFVFNSNSDENGGIARTISVYDLESNCNICGHRGEFFDVCPECGKTDIDDGYGEDTTIFVTADEIAEDIQLTTDTDAMKNCFKLEAGDDLMTATIKNCNPNGSDYIWYLSDEMKSDMSLELVTRINKYDEEYAKYQNEDFADIFKDNSELLSKYNELIGMLNRPEGSENDGKLYYNELVDKYNTLMNRKDDEKLEVIEAPIIGFPAFIDAYYNTFDMYLYLQSGLMPAIDTARPSIDEEIKKLTVENISPIAVNVSSTSSSSSPLKAVSVSTADNLVLQMAKTLIDSRYKVKIADGSVLSDYVDGAANRIWKGKITLTAYSDDDIEPQTTELLEIEVNDDYETFVKNKLDKALSAEDTEDMSISGLFAKDLAVSLTASDGTYLTDSNEASLSVGALQEQSFEAALKEYSLNRLISFRDACQSCIDIMIEMGVADGKTWGNVENADLYNDLYMVYYNKLIAITEEIAIRDAEIALIAGVYDENGDLVTAGMQTIIEDIKADIQNALDFEKFLCGTELGEKLWFEFCSFRREDKYSNDNYISDGKNNAEIISLAKEFIDTANKEIHRSAELQCSISASLKNLLVIEKFKPLINSFKVGNWLRIMVDDKVYKLRLVSYTIDYDSLDGISVEFSDTVKVNSSIKSVQDVLAQASSMATSYSAVQRQARQGEESKETINDWFNAGLNATNVKIMGGADGQCQTWDNHGMLFRELDDSTGEYSPEQMKIINSTMAITTDNWQTTKTAVGKYYYQDTKDNNKLKMAYGINAETIVGKLILGETLELHNNDNTMTFDDNGLMVTNNINTVTIDPDAESIFNIKHDKTDILYFDENGNLTIKGNITALNNLEIEVQSDDGSTVVAKLHDIAISGSYNDLEDKPKYGELEGTPTLATVATSGKYSDLSGTPKLATVATSGSYTDLIDHNELAKVSDIPTVPTTATSVSSSGTNPVSGSAVYNYAVAKNQGIGNAECLLYVGNDGRVTTLTIAGLKALLESV